MDKAKAISDLNVDNDTTSSYGRSISIRCGWKEFNVDLVGIWLNDADRSVVQSGQNPDGPAVESITGSVSFRITEMPKEEPKPEVDAEQEAVDEVPA